MTPFMLVNVQFTLTLIVFTLASVWWIWPRLASMDPRQALVPLLTIHMARYVPLALFAPGQVDAAIPPDTIATIAWGDFASALLAIAAAAALKARWSGGLLLAVLFSVVGIADVVVALVAGVRADLSTFPLGFSWYILTLYVPVLVVTHVLIVMLILRARRTSAAAAA